MGALGALPLSVRLVAGESVASFIGRLAAANGLRAADVVGYVGGTRREIDPQAVEVRLGEAAIEDLSVLAGRTVDQLRRSLPTVRRPVHGSAVRVVVWPQGHGVVQQCELCCRAAGDGPPAWLVAVQAFDVCRRHARWLGCAGSHSQMSLAGLPEVVLAHERRRRFERRVGPYGQALLADAFQVAVYWWSCFQMASTDGWARREAVLGLTRRRLWAVPIVVYPEVVTLAEAMAVRERQRCYGRAFDGQTTRWHTGRWSRWVGERLGLSEELAAGGERALHLWLMAHRNSVPVVARLTGSPPPPGYRAQQMRALAPHQRLVEGPWEQMSCLPWRLGEPMTSVTWDGEGFPA
ncbi:TniQ family protein [Streptomyces erythrochromogenes]|uniref:TniQ family protein n=1 Tax=Streptomyces erythrochromogenes TaxID=285574 RepID=UPI0038183006